MFKLAKITCLALAPIFAIPATANAEVFEIDQIMDMEALTPQDFYRFVPNYLWIETGDSVRFNNTTGNHTVKSVDGIWPEGVPHVDIAHEPAYNIKMTVPGVYGFRCTVHARHGMFALVIVGSPESNLDEVHFDGLNDRGEAVFRALFERLEAERAERE